MIQDALLQVFSLHQLDPDPAGFFDERQPHGGTARQHEWPRLCGHFDVLRLKRRHRVVDVGRPEPDVIDRMTGAGLAVALVAKSQTPP